MHERRLRDAVEQAVRSGPRGRGRSGPAAAGLFDSCIAAIPYAPATAFLANEKAKLDTRSEDGETPRVAVLADGIGSTHGVTRAIEEIRQRGVPGFEIEVLGTDPNVDRRLSAVAEFDVPYYPGLQIGVPSLSAAVQTLADGCFDVIHVCSPGPVGVAGALVSRGLGVPLVGSYHTELTAYAGLRSGEQGVADAMALGVSTFYRTCDLVLSPSPASDAALAAIGIAAEQVARWDRGVDGGRFDPALRGQMAMPDAVNVLYSGRISREKGADLLADAFLEARGATRGCTSCSRAAGPSRSACASGSATRPRSSAGWRARSWRASMPSADIFLFPSRTDTFGQVILEAQASGLPVIAVAAGGPLSLIEDRVSGLLREPDAGALAEAVLELADSPLLRERLARAGLASVAERTWEHALERLGDGYGRALRGPAPEEVTRAA